MDTLSLDIAQDNFVAFLTDDAGHPVHQQPRTFTYSPRGLRQLTAWMRDPAATRVVFESTGVYGKRIIKAFDGVVASIHELNPQIIRRFATSMVQTKTDHADVRAIAMVVHTLALQRPEKLAQSRISFEESRENLALWLAEYARLSRAAARLKNQIKNLGYAIAGVAATINQRRRAELRELQGKMREVKRAIVAAFDDREARQDVEHLCTIPGVAELTAAAVITTIRDINRFRSADALKAYLGIYPRRRQSGIKEGPARLATHGSKLVRHMLWNAARSAARFNPVCKDLFDRLVARGTHQAAAYGAVMRQLVQIIYGVLKSHQPFTIIPHRT